MNTQSQTSALRALLDRAVALKLIDAIETRDGWFLVSLDGGEIHVPEAQAAAFLRGILSSAALTAKRPRSRAAASG